MARLTSDASPNEINQALWPLAFASDPGVNHAELLPWVEEMLARGRTPDSLNTAGAIYYRAGQWEKSIELLSEAQRRRSSAEFVFDHLFLALAYEQLGQTALAQKLVNEVRDWVETQERLIEYGRAPHALYHWVTCLELELLLQEAMQVVKLVVAVALLPRFTARQRAALTNSTR